MEVQRLSSTLVQIVNFDQIPLARLLSERGMSLLNERYRFGQISPEKDPIGNPKLVFLLGSFEDDEGDILLNRVSIEERKIVITIEGSSSRAETVYEDFRTFFGKLGEKEGNDFMESVLMAFESEVVTHLDFHADRLLAPVFHEFVKTDVLEAASIDISDSYIVPNMISFRLEYPKIEDVFHDYRISLSRKEFTLGPRQGFPLEERIFVSKGPFDTKTHLDLLEKIEKLFSDK